VKIDVGFLILVDATFATWIACFLRGSHSLGWLAFSEEKRGKCVVVLIPARFFKPGYSF